MNARTRFVSIVFILVIGLSACSPAGTLAPIAQEPRRSSNPVYATAEARPMATAASMPLPDPAEGNTYKDYGVNPPVDSRRDHLSTFALDVDTASYSVARRYIGDGRLPPYDAVRVEEFVNAFDAGYAAPYEAAFTLYADGAPAPAEWEWDVDGGNEVIFLRLGVQGYQVPAWERKPAALTFVIDVSGSMSMENRLELVKQSLRLLVEELDERDTVGVVVYGSKARVVLEHTSAARKGVILSAIDRLQPEGSTNAEAGLRLGYRQAMGHYLPDGINRVVLCSDGVANVGNTQAEAILESVAGYVQEGITLTTIGVGMGNFNDVLLEQLADRGDGHYAYVDTLAEARKVFVDNLTSTLQVIAKDAKVQVDFNPEVVISYRLLGYENRAVADHDFRNDQLDAGELGAGHSATAIYALRLNPSAQGRIATMLLRWQDPDTGEVREINGSTNTWDLAARFEEAVPHYQLAVLVAQFAELLRESPYAARISLNELARRSAVVARQLPADEQAAELDDLIRQAARLTD
jgi:Ca-activated chloride channel family protein